MATVDIRLDGVSITDRVLYQRTTFTSMAGGQPGTASVTIDNSDRGITWEDVHAGSTLELFIDGAREWDGWVFGFERSWPFEYDDTTVPADTPIFWTINGYDRNLLFQKRIMLNKSDPSDNRGFKIWPADTPDKTAITYALDNYVELSGDGLSFDIREIDSPSPWEEFTLGFVSAPMGILFEDCAEMTGGVYWIGPDRKLHYRSDRDVTAPFELSDAPTAGQVGYRELDASLDYTQAATEALVWGAGKGSDEPVFAKYTNTTARDTYGLWQWGDLYVGASEQQTVNRRARTYVNGSPTHRQGHDEPVPVVRCVVFQPGIRAGMVVLFIATMFAYSEALPVRSSTISFPTPDQPRYELEMSLNIDTPFGIPDKWWEEENPYREYIPPEGTGTIDSPPPVVGGNLIDHFDQTPSEGGAATGGVMAQKFGFASSSSDESYIYWTVTYPTTLQSGDYVLLVWTGAASETQFVFPADDGNAYPAGYTVIDSVPGGDVGEYISQTAIYQAAGGETSMVFKVTDMGYTPTMNFYVAVVRGASGYGESAVPGIPISVYTGWPIGASDTSITGYPVTPWTYYGKTETGVTAIGVANHAWVESATGDTGEWVQDANGTGAENVWYFSFSSAPEAAGEAISSGVASGATWTISLPEVGLKVGDRIMLYLTSTETTSPNATISPTMTYMGGTGSDQLALVYMATVSSTATWGAGIITVTWTTWNNSGPQSVSGSWVAQVVRGVVSGYVENGPLPTFGQPLYWPTEDFGDYRPTAYHTIYVWATKTSFDGDGTIVLYESSTPVPGWEVVASGLTDPKPWIMVKGTLAPGAEIESYAYQFYESNYDGDGYVMAFGFDGTSAYPSGTPSAVLKTPPPEVTGAPWAGGNVWHRSATYSATGAEQDAVVSNSIVRRGPLYLYLLTWDTWIDLFTNEDLESVFLQPSYQGATWPDQRYPWSGFSTAWWSGGVLDDAEGTDLLIKWRHRGDIGTNQLGIELDQVSIPVAGATPHDVWFTNTRFYIKNGNHTIYPYAGKLTSNWPWYVGDNYESDFIYPFHAYHSGSGPSLSGDTWYWTRIKVGQNISGFGFPYTAGSGSDINGTGWNLTLMKTWPVGEDEPTSGTSDPFNWYWYFTAWLPGYPPPVPVDEIVSTIDGGWDIALPQAWVKNIDPDADPDNPPAQGDWYNLWQAHNTLKITESLSASFEIDGIWRYSSSLDQGGVIGGGTGAIVSDIPIYDNTANTEAGTYITRYPYVPGSLKVWYQGMSLTRNADFLETDPSSGMFTITGGRDISSALLVEYYRAGTEPTSGYTGGNVYRPVPVLQYGWGTALDGYNCTMACGCMALDRHTLGQYTQFAGTPRATPPNMRGFQYDQSGGTDLGDVATAWSNGWGQTLQYVGTTTWSNFVNLINSGRGAILQGWYGNLPASKRFSSSFTGGHAIYINEQFSNGNFYGCDPLYRYPVVYTPAELQAYAVGFISAGLVSAAFTKVT